MEKELTLPEVFKLLYEGKKVRKTLWNKGSYIHFVNDILVNNNGHALGELVLNNGRWCEYKGVDFKFDDFVEGYRVRANIAYLGDDKKGIVNNIFTFEVSCVKEKYVVLESTQNGHAFILTLEEYKELVKDDKFFIEEA